jgi:hypothetical protein
MALGDVLNGRGVLLVFKNHRHSSLQLPFVHWIRGQSFKLQILNNN